MPCPALPCPALPCPAVPCPALPCPACPALPCPALPCPVCPPTVSERGCARVVAPTRIGPPNPSRLERHLQKDKGCTPPIGLPNHDLERFGSRPCPALPCPARPALPLRATLCRVRGAGCLMETHVLSSSGRHRPRGPTTRHQSISAVLCCAMWLFLCRTAKEAESKNAPLGVGAGRRKRAISGCASIPKVKSALTARILNPKP